MNDFILNEGLYIYIYSYIYHMKIFKFEKYNWKKGIHCITSAADMRWYKKRKFKNGMIEIT